MVVIPPGSFLMGSSAADTARDMTEVAPPQTGFSMAKLFGETDAQRGAMFMAYEHPQHRVTIPKAFAMGKYLVTVWEFMIFVRETGYKTGACDITVGDRLLRTAGSAWQKPGFPVTARDPVVCVGWDDAKAYIAWLNKKSGNIDGAYRLPTEAEWEYAARAGTQTSRYWGNAIGEGNANCGGCKNQSVGPPIILGGVAVSSPCCGYDRQRTTPVDHYPPNLFGLYDMLGNADEWTEDCWHANYNGAPADGSAWDSGECSERVTRGADWNGYVTWPARAASRTRFDRTTVFDVIGFRVAKTLQ
jgi:formylglycine-generating enzyme required for sulfatase activity